MLRSENYGARWGVFSGLQSPIVWCRCSANHDERVFVDPERFDVICDASEHIAFSLGIHYCLGANLARLEGGIALEEMLQKLGRLERIDADDERINLPVLRGPKSLRPRWIARP